MYSKNLFEQQRESEAEEFYFETTQQWPLCARDPAFAAEVKTKNEIKNYIGSLYFPTADNNKIWIPFDKPAFKNIQLFVPRYKFGNEMDTMLFLYDGDKYYPDAPELSPSDAEKFNLILRENCNKIHWECSTRRSEKSDRDLYIPRFKYHCKLDQHYFNNIATVDGAEKCYFPVIKVHYDKATGKYI
jgi:hypothetical protein